MSLAEKRFSNRYRLQRVIFQLGNNKSLQIISSLFADNGNGELNYERENIMFWIVIIIVAIVVIAAVAKSRNKPQNSSPPQPQHTQASPSQSTSVATPYPPRFAHELSMLKDPAMISVAKTAWRILSIERSLDPQEVKMVHEFIRGYIQLVPNSEEFCFYESVCGIANNAFVNVFIKWSRMFYKSAGLVAPEYYLGQLDIYIGTNKLMFGDKQADDYDEDLDDGYESYLECFENKPSEEAANDNIPIEQTNWYAVIRGLSERVKNPIYLTYSLRSAQELLTIKDTELHFIGDFAARVVQDQNYASIDMERSKEFMRKYILCIDDKLDEMAKYSVTMLAAPKAFIKVIMAEPCLLYKNSELVNADFFRGQLDMEMDNQASPRGETDYQLRRQIRCEYFEAMKEYPSLEANHCGIPVEQTNWHEVVEVLRNYIED